MLCFRIIIFLLNILFITVRKRIYRYVTLINVLNHKNNKITKMYITIYNKK